jgi:hypothetical protein
LGGLLFALGILGLLLVKDRIPLPIAHFLGLGDAYPTQGLIGPQKFIHGWESASRPSPSEGHTPQSQQSPKPNEARDPDTIYQYGHSVGKVVAPEAHLAEGYWTFSRIMADGAFDGSRDFEYRDQRLKILSAESPGRIGTMGQIQQNFANVRATILGER